MQYVPDPPKAKGKKGEATVRQTKEGIVIMLGDEAFQFSPDQVTLPAGFKNGSKWFVELSALGDRFFGMRPTVIKGGVFQPTGLRSLTHWREEREQLNKKTGQYFHVNKLWFTVNAELVEGPYEGSVFGFRLLYKDLARPNGPGFSLGQNMLTIYQGKSGEALQALQFLTVSGVMDVDIPFSDNVLPALEQILKSRGRQFKADVVNGYPDLSTLEEYVVPAAKRRATSNGKKK